MSSCSKKADTVLSDTGLLGWCGERSDIIVYEENPGQALQTFLEDQSLDLEPGSFKEFAFPSEIRLESSLVHSLMPTS